MSFTGLCPVSWPDKIQVILVCRPYACAIFSSFLLFSVFLSILNSFGSFKFSYSCLWTNKIWIVRNICSCFSKDISMKLQLVVEYTPRYVFEFWRHEMQWCLVFLRKPYGNHVLSWARGSGAALLWYMAAKLPQMRGNLAFKTARSCSFYSLRSVLLGTDYADIPVIFPSLKMTIISYPEYYMYIKTYSENFPSITTITVQ